MDALMHVIAGIAALALIYLIIIPFLRKKIEPDYTELIKEGQKAERELTKAIKELSEVLRNVRNKNT